MHNSVSIYTVFYSFKYAISYNIVLTVMFLQEIIEFPVLKVNGRTFETEAQFHQYVQPDVHKELTDFCTEVCSSDRSVSIVFFVC